MMISGAHVIVVVRACSGSPCCGATDDDVGLFSRRLTRANPRLGACLGALAGSDWRPFVRSGRLQFQGRQKVPGWRAWALVGLAGGAVWCGPSELARPF